MTTADFKFLQSARARKLIQANLGKEHAKFALSYKGNAKEGSLIAQQIKYLQKAQSKFSQFFEAQCILTGRAFEQASSHDSARLKNWQGQRCLDLTCGLGVDSLHFSGQFEQVVSLEADPILADISRYNLTQLLDCKNLQVINAEAADWLSHYEGPQFDLIYIDPDRRDAQGRRQLLLQDCSPDVLSLMPLLQQHGNQIVIKLSPLFDLNELVRLFPSLASIWVISVNNECREVLAVIQAGHQEAIPLEIHSLRQGRHDHQSYVWQVSRPTISTTVVEGVAYLFEPDVAYYKARRVASFVQRHFEQKTGFLSGPMGYWLSREEPTADLPGRRFTIVEALPYKPKALKRYLKQQKISRINISSREMGLSVKEIRKALSIAEGGEQYLICTRLADGSRMAYHCERI